MNAMASQIAGASMVCSTVCSGAEQRKQAPHHWPFWGNSPVTGEFSSQRASNAENVSIWWRHHVMTVTSLTPERCDSGFKSGIPNTCYGLGSWAILVKALSGECHGIHVTRWSINNGSDSALCRQATSHYLRQCGPSSMSPYHMASLDPNNISPYTQTLTLWGRDEMTVIFQTSFSNGFSWMGMYEFWLCRRSLFLAVQVTIFQQWFRKSIVIFG